LGFLGHALDSALIHIERFCGVLQLEYCLTYYSYFIFSGLDIRDRCQIVFSVRAPTQRALESTDGAIDKLVYELSHSLRSEMIYGLNEEEIEIVEG